MDISKGGCQKCPMKSAFCTKDKALLLLAFVLVVLGNIGILIAYYYCLILPEAVLQTGGVM
ncbi:hypothetical protein [Vibrio owensii]|uniref:hypothetical protein n=1 Tax=Vibrio owensii TaxID=696485 RepID=UPI0018F21ECC|nr:hypothetical protein [Vibrio owensii]